MDPMTIAIALLTAVIAVLAALVWLGHLDIAQVVSRMDRAIERMDRSLEHMDHAVEHMDQSTAACNRAADACQSMADAMVRWFKSRSCATGRNRGPLNEVMTELGQVEKQAMPR